MKKILAILRHEFRQTIRQKGYIIMVISLPLLAIVGYGVAQAVQHWSESDAPEEQKIGYVDEPGILLGDYTGSLDIEFVPYVNEPEARSTLLAGEVDEYFIVTKDYMATGGIVRFVPEGETDLSGKVGKAMEGFLLASLLEADVSDNLMERVKTPMIVASYGLDEAGEIAPESDEWEEIAVPLIFAMLFMMSIFFASGFMLQSVSEEKENRVMEILLSSVSARQLLVGKVLGLGAAALLQMALWLVTIMLFFKVASVNISALEDISVSPEVVFLGLLYFLIGYLFFAALMAGIGSIGTTMKESQSLSMLITMPGGLGPFYLFIFTQESEGALFTALSLFPLTAPVMGMIRVSAHTIGGGELALSLILLAGSSVLAMWAAAKVFRAFLLMYGKRPGIREIARSLKQA